MAEVWSDPYFGQGDKVKLLVALSIADCARSEDGRAWPSIDSIARKSRTSIRGAQEAVRQMQKDGKLQVDEAKGPHGTNVYLLCLPPHPAHPANGAPRKRAAEKAAEKAPPVCTQSVRNGNEPSGIPSPLPPPARPSGVTEGRGSDLIPTTEQSKRIAQLVNRRLTTPWSTKEIEAYRKIGTVEGEDMTALERYYTSERAKGDGDKGGRHRRDLMTLLNNFTGELDRARSFRPFTGVSKCTIDDKEWRRFLTSIERPYEEAARAMPFLREDFTKWQRLQ